MPDFNLIFSPKIASMGGLNVLPLYVTLEKQECDIYRKLKVAIFGNIDYHCRKNKCKNFKPDF